MKIVKKKKWHQKKANKKLSYKFKKNKNVILYLKKICLCIGMIIFWQTIINAKEKINNKSKTKVCLCCIGKKENLYIADFINHYQKLGYNHIYLYDNNNIDEERFDEVIKDKIDSGFVTVMNYRGYRGRKDDAQMDAYYDCYHRYNSECNWISFFDIDEYLFLMPINGTKIRIQQYLDQPKFDHCETIKINWKSYSDSELLYYENKSVLERFTKLSKFGYEFGNVKSTIRTNITHFMRRTYSPHSVFSSIRGCLSSGARKQIDFFMFPPNYKGAYINHYVTKTISEFCNKIKRGNAEKSFALDQGKLGERFHYFFMTNVKTQEKVDIFNKIFNTSFK
jgi:hypothetical protein